MSKADDLMTFSIASIRYADVLGPFIGYGYNVDEKLILANFYGGLVASDGNIDFYSRLERVDMRVKTENWSMIQYVWTKLRGDYKALELVWKDYDVAKAWMENDIKRGEK